MRRAGIGIALAGAAMFAGSFWLLGVSWWFLNSPAENSPASWGAHCLAFAGVLACVFGVMGSIALGVIVAAMASDA